MPQEMTLRRCSFYPGSYSETNVMGLQAALELGTNQGGKQKRYVTFIKHFISRTHPSPENPILVLDNDSSYIRREILDTRNKNEVVLLPFPPHCSHRFQPLDISVYRSFMARCETEISSWPKSHPGKNLTISELTEITSYTH
jgi:hypothetical protein